MKIKKTLIQSVMVDDKNEYQDMVCKAKDALGCHMRVKGLYTIVPIHMVCIQSCATLERLCLT